MPQAGFLNSGINGFEFLDKIVQVPFCLPELETNQKHAYLSNIVGGSSTRRELDPKHALPEARFSIAQDLSYAQMDAQYSNYKPMMDAHERECLARLCPFADGNPRRLKRIINVFNVGRRVVELRRGEDWSGLAEFKPKLLKFVIMLEQWPYRAPARPKRQLPPTACCGHPRHIAAWLFYWHS